MVWWNVFNERIGVSFIREVCLSKCQTDIWTKAGRDPCPFRATTRMGSLSNHRFLSIPHTPASGLIWMETNYFQPQQWACPTSRTDTATRRRRPIARYGSLGITEMKYKSERKIASIIRRPPNCGVAILSAKIWPFLSQYNILLSHWSGLRFKIRRESDHEKS